MTDSGDARAEALLAALDDAELGAALLESEPLVGVGGGSSVIDVGGVPVFAKRVPITDRELDRPHSTANLYDTPLTCQYGMYRLPGPGFNAWRELAANTMVSGPFPRLYHWRILPGRPPIAPEHRDVDAVVAQFGGDPGVRARLDDLSAARFSLTLFLQHIPYPSIDLWKDPAEVERQLFEIVASLRTHGVLHMDGHRGNLRSDGERFSLVDFGLATSPRFDLSPAEREFVAGHADHDADYASALLVNWLSGVADVAARHAWVRRCADGHIPSDVPERTAEILARHAPAAARMNAFHWRLYDGDLTATYR